MSHASHITLMVSEGNGSAKFLVSHPEVARRSLTLNNKGLFSKYPAGSRIVVRIRMSERYRHILEARPAVDTENTDEKFIKSWARSLYHQAVTLGGDDPDTKAWIASLKGLIEISGTGEAVSPVKVTVEEMEVQTKSTVFQFGAIPEGNGYWVNNVFVSEEDAKILATVVEMSKASQVNVLMAGPSGYGKTSIPEAIATNMGYKFVRINCAQIRDPEEWFGYREARGGETVFIPTEFTRAVTEGHAIIVMDEFNRIEPWLHNTLYPLLDHARKTTVHDVEIICGPDLIFVSTVNLGHQFVGTFMLDTALMNRMDAIISVSALPAEIEKKLLISRVGIDRPTASKIVNVMIVLRELTERNKLSVDASTRTSLKLARFCKAGFTDFKLALASVVFGALDPAEAKVAADAVAAHL